MPTDEAATLRRDAVVSLSADVAAVAVAAASAC